MITILILKRKIKLVVSLAAVSWLVFLNASNVFAQNSLTLSVSPIIYTISAIPGQDWPSSLRVINVNDYELTVYLEVVNFAQRDESGDGRFILVSETDQDGSTIAEWFTLSSAPVVIQPQQSVDVPFIVKFPKDAAPGGHFAAIMVGTRPPSGQGKASRVQTSQTISSLFFARLEGDVVENGLIREFATSKRWLDTPEVDFSLRFDNRGNVHLQPQGEIKIYNMWGQERGIIPINQRSQFGNVLPGSTREYSFTWKGEWSVSDIGRYKAQVALAYGTSEKKFSASETTFWIIPYKLLATIIIVLAFFIFTLSWLVKLYVRHVLKLAGLTVKIETKPSFYNRFNFHKPVQAGILDLRQRLKAGDRFKDYLFVTYNFIWQYKKFFGAILLILTFFAILIWFIGNAKTSYRAFEVIYSDNEAGRTLSSEDIIYNQKRGVNEVLVNEDLPTLSIINKSGNPGQGADLKIELEALGYNILSLRADFTTSQSKTVLIAKPESYTKALPLSLLLGKVLISPSSAASEPGEITIILGSDV